MSARLKTVRTFRVVVLDDEGKTVWTSGELVAEDDPNAIEVVALEQPISVPPGGSLWCYPEGDEPFRLQVQGGPC